MSISDPSARAIIADGLPRSNAPKRVIVAGRHGRADGGI